MRIVLTFLLGFGLATPVWATSAADCSRQAAVDFGISPRVFQAFSLAEMTMPAELRDTSEPRFGVMHLSASQITRAAEALQQSEVTLRREACANYRAAAWLLTHPEYVSQPKQLTDWERLNHFYYRKLGEGPKVAYVRKLYNTYTVR